MKILLVAATRREIAILNRNKKNFKNKLEVLITGPGIVSTTYHLARKLREKEFDLVINAGIAGSFSKNISLGSVLNVTEESFSDLGAEDGKNFIPVADLKFKGDDFPLLKKKMVNRSPLNSKIISSLPKVKGNTVNTVHGNEKSISKTKKLFPADIETMEGAAFFYVCGKEKIPFVQIRSVSNYIEKRNRSKWKMEVAILNLNETLIKIFWELL